MDNEKVFARIGRLMRETSESGQWESRKLISGVELPDKDEEVSYEKMEELRSLWTAGQWVSLSCGFPKNWREAST